MKRARLFLPLFIFAALAGLFASVMKHDPSEIPSALLNKPWPVFSLATLETGQSVSERDLQGHKALVNVWATWCVTCRVEHGYLLQLSQSGIPFYSVNYKDTVEDARNWLQDKGNPFRFSVMDVDGRLGIDLGVSGAPETYMIDSKGVIRYKHVGAIDEHVWQEKLLPVWQKLQ